MIQLLVKIVFRIGAFAKPKRLIARQCINYFLLFASALSIAENSFYKHYIVLVYRLVSNILFIGRRLILIHTFRLRRTTLTRRLTSTARATANNAAAANSATSALLTTTTRYNRRRHIVEESNI